jgi:PPOX class probable F420-dependent enzyme
MDLKQFESQQYLNIETLRKSGEAVKTPVWFVQEGEIFHIWTEAGSGKAKRIRNNGAVRIAPCKASGELLGDWIPAHAQADESPDAITNLEKLMKAKYGPMFNIFGFLGKMRGGQKYTAITIQP